MFNYNSLLRKFNCHLSINFNSAIRESSELNADFVSCTVYKHCRVLLTHQLCILVTKQSLIPYFALKFHFITTASSFLRKVVSTGQVCILKHTHITSNTCIKNLLIISSFMYQYQAVICRLLNVNTEATILAQFKTLAVMYSIFLNAKSVSISCKTLHYP